MFKLALLRTMARLNGRHSPRNAAIGALSGAALLLSACAGPSAIGGASDLRVMTADALPAPDGRGRGSENRPYFIGPFDRLVVDVFGVEELSKREVQTDSSGRFSFPLAGIVEAAGKTPAEVEVDLTARLRSAFVRDPQVTINLRETGSQFVTVDGQVTQPGLYPVVGRMTLMRAIATARGTAEFAKLDDVVVFRTVAGQKYAAIYNLSAIRRGNYADPEIYADDVVVVGDSEARRRFKDLLQVAPLLSTPLLIAFQ